MSPSISIPIAIFLLLCILLRLFRISGQLAKISAGGSVKVSGKSSGKKSSTVEPEVAPSAEVRSGSDFEEFLREDPLRQSMPKEDQFEAFRKWRKEKGITWSGGQ